MQQSGFGDMHVIIDTQQCLQAASEANGRGKSIVFSNDSSMH